MSARPIRVAVDPRLGGRWSSLVGRTGREWLWRNDVPGRGDVRPGDAFVDAGGLEECLPTIGGEPDHGEVWSRPWTAEADGALSVSAGPFTLRRAMTVDDSGVAVRYRLTGEPGTWFVWAAHTALGLARGARLLAPSGRPMWVNDDRGTSQAAWPRFDGTDLARLGDDDGSALMVIIPWLRSIAVLDGDDVLTMTLEVAEQPYAMAVWRNLGGRPIGAPYRSIVLEPMVGHSPTLSLAGEGEAAVIPPSGEVTWTMTVDG